MRWLRQLLLELWAMGVMAALIGFLGPFGTYSDKILLARIADWWQLLMGAYLIVRPAILLLERIAATVSLPQRPLVFWGVVAVSAPLTIMWGKVGADTLRKLGGLAGLAPFSLLCALAVLGVVWWAHGVAERFSANLAEVDRPTLGAPVAPSHPSDFVSADVPTASDREPEHCALLARLGQGFCGPILALQSEDHYVRVHGRQGSELLLMRLRDAIAEVGEVPGEQVHRSWWVAKEGIESFELSGRTATLRLTNGAIVPVARDSAQRLRKSGFLPENARTARSQS